jgi:hypothetical protein
MNSKLLLLAFTLMFSQLLFGQNTLNYSIELTPVAISNLPGLHSFAFGQADGKWLVIGGRKDGLHARQPFNAFPESSNNTDIYVIDVNTQQFWSASVNSLPASISEQLQSTNMNFHQDGDTLYIVGGYAFSPTANDHITFPNLTTVQVSSVINAIIGNSSVSSYFKQITDSAFAITGGHLAQLEGTFYIIGGHRFDGRYNPMGHATYVQSYSNQIRKFNIDNNGSQLSFSNYTTITDQVHLHRRDYNLVPQVFTDGTEGYTISSGVFQPTVDLPYLYPVDITPAGHAPISSFNQYLSNYHSAILALYDSTTNNMHSLFFGGMSQYYYQNDSLIKDDLVPFVKTISQVTRFSDGSLQEFQLPVEMPSLKGASAEFIPNESLPYYTNGVLKLSAISADTILAGYILGGIASSTENPFSNNQTNLTNADNTVYAVRLIKGEPSGIKAIQGSNPFSFEIYPNPTDGKVSVTFKITNNPTPVSYFITTSSGQIIKQGKIENTAVGNNVHSLEIDSAIAPQMLLVTLVFEGKFSVTQKVTKK